MSEIIKNIKQYSTELSGNNYDKLFTLTQRYINTKNYFYHKYSGINSVIIIQNHRKEIRDELLKNKNLIFC